MLKSVMLELGNVAHFELGPYNPQKKKERNESCAHRILWKSHQNVIYLEKSVFLLDFVDWVTQLKMAGKSVERLYNLRSRYVKCRSGTGECSAR